MANIGSARTPPTAWQLLLLPVCLFVPIGLLLCAGADGLMWCGAVLATAMALTVSLRLVAVVAGLAVRRSAGSVPLSEDDPDLPRYSILVPLYHEAAVVPHLLGALAALRWPRDRSEVLILVEEDDQATAAALSVAVLPEGVRWVTVPDGQPRTKPRACNYGLGLATGELVVVFDAEDRPEPDQLLRAAAAFRALPASCACLQARLQADHRGHGAPALGFAIDYAVWFDLYLPGLHAVGSPIPLGGTSNHFRSDALRAVGGWDVWNVTEDADLGVRLARHGLATAVIDSTTWEEAPSQWGPWLRQRSRWMKGWWQTALVHTRDPLALLRDLGVKRTAWWLATIPGQVLAALAAPACWLLLGLGYLLGWPMADPARPWTGALLVATIALLLVNLVFIALTALAAWRRHRRLGALLTPLLPVYWLAVSVAAWRGVLQFHSDPFRWEKTPHAAAAVPPPSFMPALAAAPAAASAGGRLPAPPQDTVPGRWRLTVAVTLLVSLAGIIAIAWTSPGWTGFTFAVDRRSIDLEGAAAASQVLTPEADWLPHASLQASLSLDAPAARPMPVRLTFSLSVLDGTWFQREVETVIPAGANAATVAVALHGEGWSDPAGKAEWASDWLRRVRGAGVRAWLPYEAGHRLNVALVPFASHQPAPLAIIPGPAPVGLATRRMAEVHFRLNRAYDNPFDPDQIEAWADIQGPDGSIRRAEAFATQDYSRRMVDGSEILDPLGAPGWAVRFTPAQPGGHTVRLHARDLRGDQAVSEPIACMAAAGEGAGFVRTDGRWFTREDGSFLYPIPLNLRSPRDDLLNGIVEQPQYRAGTEPYSAWIERCGAAGINVVRPWLAPGFLGLEWNRDWRGYHGIGKYNLENAWRVDRLLHLAARNRVMVELALWQHGPWSRIGAVDSQWQDNPYRQEVGGPLADPAQAPFDPDVRRLHRQYARYAAARWGADPTLFGWTLWIEVDGVAGDRSTADWHADIASELTARAWGRQPVSGQFRSATGDAAVWSLPGISYTQLAGYAAAWPSGNLFKILQERASSLSSWSKPAIIEEYGGTSDGGSPRALAQDLHDGLWASWGLDLAAAPMPWWWNLVFTYGLERQQRRFNAFIAGADLRGTTWRTGQRMLRHGGRAFVRIGPDRAWAWLRPSGRQPSTFNPLAADPGPWFTADPARTVDLTTLGLPSGRWRVEVWDTWCDIPPTVHEITVGNGQVLLPIPEATRDLALKCERIPAP